MPDLPTTQQRDAVKTISPPWLAQGNNEKYMYNLGLSSDLVLEKLNQASKAHMPGIGTSAALPYIGADMVMKQGALELNSSFASRLSRGYDAWQRAGSRKSVMSQAIAYVRGYFFESINQIPACTIVGNDSDGDWATWATYYTTSDFDKSPSLIRKTPSNFNWDNEYHFWRAWLVMHFGPGSLLQPEDTWGNGNWGDEDGSWGIEISPNFFIEFRNMIRVWKSSTTHYPWFIFNFAPGTGDVGDRLSPNSNPGSGNPNGTWGEWGIIVDGVYVPSRPDDCRFVDGTGEYINCTEQSGT